MSENSTRLSAAPGTPPLVQLKGIAKYFPGVIANEDVDLDVPARRAAFRTESLPVGRHHTQQRSPRRNQRLEVELPGSVAVAPRPRRGQHYRIDRWHRPSWIGGYPIVHG